MAEPESSSDGQSELPAVVPGGELRASHEDRDRVVEVLRVAAGDGRLSPDELDDRLERALGARTYAELAVLTADLPATPGVAAVPAAAASVTPKDLVRIEVRSSATRRDGPWVVPKELDIQVISGTVTLDFTQAVITQPVLRITAEVKGGLLTLITKPGIVVEAGDVSVRSGLVKVTQPPDPGTPILLRIEVAGSARGGTILARPPGPPSPPRPPRRTFWQWLRRAPRPAAIAPPQQQSWLQRRLRRQPDQRRVGGIAQQAGVVDRGETADLPGKNYQAYRIFTHISGDVSQPGRSQGAGR